MRIRIFVLLVVALLIAAGVWWWRQGATTSAGMSPLETWCADELRRIAADLLAPTLAFDTLQLELPAAVTLTDVSLTSEGTAIVTMTSMRLEFRERPKRGRPLVIAAARFVDPEVRLIGRADGTLQGFAGFMKSTTGEKHADGGSSRPSDFLAIRRIAIENGMLEWAPYGRDTPMQLHELAMDLTTSPDADRPGWYAFKANIERAPIVQLDWDGGISIDDGDLAFDDTTLQVNLSEDDYATLPPTLQDLLREHGIVGALTVHATGHLPLSDARATDLTFDASLRNAHAAIGEYEFPIDSAELKATFAQMQLAARSLSVNAFGGTVDASGTLGVETPHAFTVQAQATDVLIQDMLRHAPGEPPELSGKVALTLDASGERHGGDATAKGSGTLTITEASLMNVPTIGAVAMKAKARPKAGTEHGEVEFTIAGDRVTIVRSHIVSDTTAASGTGDVRYNGRLDLKVNVGGVEKAESLLGGVGKVLGAVTDKLLAYRVSGTWSDPVVTPEPLGLPLGAVRGR